MVSLALTVVLTLGHRQISRAAGLISVELIKPFNLMVLAINVVLEKLLMQARDIV
jgi:Na+-translocating ferredoxin:NAD+ oxidoreductase RnfE subunit